MAGILGRVVVVLDQELSKRGGRGALIQRVSEHYQTPEYVLACLAREAALREAISQSCAEWVNGAGWPMMRIEDAGYLLDRVFYACAYSRQLLEAGFEWNKTESELFVWLL